MALQHLIDDQRLLPLADKVERGERLGFEDGLLLYETPDLTGVGALAHHVRIRLHGKILCSTCRGLFMMISQWN
jgi:aminodeoxyfutalosine synthase